MNEDILNFQVSSNSTAKCCSIIMNWLTQKEYCHWLACLNPHSYVVSLNDVEFSQALAKADLLIPDGVGVVIASKILGGSISNRITGSDIFFELNNQMDANGGSRVFFLGSTKDTLDLINNNMSKDYPNITIAGSYSPPFKDEFSQQDIDNMVNIINKARPDVLWIGMTAPKQEKWIFNNYQMLDVRFAAAIGAVFNFYAGNVPRSHKFFREYGMEWLPRLIRQPFRLSRRVFVSAPVFLYHVAIEKIKSLK
jgi:N-acetylglucosaminyldiphosphoundecaprenol N-acetyl-beta-D-mannosaminyltransferase